MYAVSRVQSAASVLLIHGVLNQENQSDILKEKNKCVISRILSITVMYT